MLSGLKHVNERALGEMTRLVSVEFYRICIQWTGEGKVENRLRMNRHTLIRFDGPNTGALFAFTIVHEFKIVAHEVESLQRLHVKHI